MYCEMLEKLESMPDMLTERQVSEVLNIAMQTLRKKRHLGIGGLPYCKLFGTMVRYPKPEVKKHILEKMRGMEGTQ